MSSVEKDANLLNIHNLLPFTYIVAFASNESRGICEKWVILMGPQLGNFGTKNWNGVDFQFWSSICGSHNLSF